MPRSNGTGVSPRRPAKVTYDVIAHARMLAVNERSLGYQRAIMRAVPAKTVLDLGCGTGIWSLVAVGAGATLVMAVEISDIVAIAEDAAVYNRRADRLRFIKGDVRDIELPHKVDVIISDLRGVLPVFRDSLGILIEARDKWLKPGGQVIPRLDRLCASPVTSPELYRQYIEIWSSRKNLATEIGFPAGKRMATNRWYRYKAEPTSLLSRPCALGGIVYSTLASADFQGSAKFDVDVPGKCHGFAVWFDCEVDEEVSFSNAPGTDSIYGQAFFPIATPVELQVGQRVEFDVTAINMGSGNVWRWRLRTDDHVTEQCNLDGLLAQ